MTGWQVALLETFPPISHLRREDQAGFVDGSGVGARARVSPETSRDLSYRERNTGIQNPPTGDRKSFHAPNLGANNILPHPEKPYHKTSI